MESRKYTSWQIMFFLVLILFQQSIIITLPSPMNPSSSKFYGFQDKFNSEKGLTGSSGRETFSSSKTQGYYATNGLSGQSPHGISPTIDETVFFEPAPVGYVRLGMHEPGKVSADILDAHSVEAHVRGQTDRVKPGDLFQNKIGKDELSLKVNRKISYQLANEDLKRLGPFYNDIWDVEVVKEAEKFKPDGLWDFSVTRLIKGDGNCQFRALALLFIGDQEAHMAMRNFIMPLLKKKGERWKDYIDLELYPDWNHYVAAMERPGEYGDHLTLACMAEFCKRPFVVLMETADGKGVSRTTVRPEEVDPNDQEPYLLYHSQHHYELLLQDQTPQPNVAQAQSSTTHSFTPHTSTQQTIPPKLLNSGNRRQATISNLGQSHHLLPSSSESGSSQIDRFLDQDANLITRSGSHGSPTSGRFSALERPEPRNSNEAYPYPTDVKGPRRKLENTYFIAQSDAERGKQVSYEKAETLLKETYKVDQTKAWSYDWPKFRLTKNTIPLWVTTLNSQFDSFFKYLNAYGIQPTDLRSEVVKYMLEDKTRLKGYEQMEKLYGSWGVYCQFMSHSLTPGDRFSLQALAEIYGTVVVVMNKVPHTEKVWLQEFSPITESKLQENALMMYCDENQMYGLILSSWN